jgi:hypothetical protein
MFGEARDRAGIFGHDGPFRATETGLPDVSCAKAPENYRQFHRPRETVFARDCVVGLVGAPPSSNIKGLPAQTPIKANIGRKGHLPAVTNTAPLVPIFGTPKSRHRFRKIFAPARRLLLPMAPPPCAIDRMPVIARRVLRTTLIGHSDEKTRRGRKLPEGGRP